MQQLLLRTHAPMLPPAPPQATSPTGQHIITCKGAPQIVRDLLEDPAAREAVDRWGRRGRCSAAWAQIGWQRLLPSWSSCSLHAA